MAISSISSTEIPSVPRAEAFLAAERRIADVHAGGFDLYDGLHSAARLLVPTDAFYVCLVRRNPSGLHFVYNCEGDLFDTPEPFPLGDGPTSRVALTGRPVIMIAPEHRVGLALRPFADEGTQSGSAVHWPLWIETSPPELPDGVLSVQAYASGAYGPSHLAAIEWLTRRATDAMSRHLEAEDARRSAHETALSANRDRAVEDVRRFVDVLQGLAALKDDPLRLVSEIRRQQVALTEWAPTASIAQDSVNDALAALSPRELEVLAYVAQGMSTKEVADALCIAPNTVKRHLDNVYSGGVLTRRAEVAAAAPAIQAARMARKGH